MSNHTEKGKTQSFWDANPCGSSPTWDQARALRFEYTDAYLREYHTESLLAGQDVLEVGCGQGHDAAEIVRHCASYVGMDLSGESAAVARREVLSRSTTGASIAFVNSDAENLPFADGQFSLVYSIGVLHHTPGFDEALTQIHRVLRKDGKLVLMLYRSYNPLWVVLRTVRGGLRVPVLGPWVKRRTLERLRARKAEESDSLTGTALLELVGCPVIDTYTLRSLRRRMKGRYEIEHADFFRVGFDQFIRVLPRRLRAHWPRASVDRWESRLRRRLGFYMMVVATKR